MARAASAAVAPYLALPRGDAASRAHWAHTQRGTRARDSHGGLALEGGGAPSL